MFVSSVVTSLDIVTCRSTDIYRLINRMTDRHRETVKLKMMDIYTYIYIYLYIDRQMDVL